MAIDTDLKNLSLSSAKASQHPLSPLTAHEITSASYIVQQSWPSGTDLHFKTVTLEEPPKSLVLPYLDAEHSNNELPSVPRKAFVNYYIRNTVCHAQQIIHSLPHGLY